MSRDAPACGDLGAAGEVARGAATRAAGGDDEEPVDCALSVGHADGATTQSMNPHAAAIRVTSSRTVMMP
jgi:hypothetical protein